MIYVASKKPLSVKRKDAKDSIKVDGTEYPQYESINDFVSAAGSEERALSYLNSAAKADSAVPARVYAASVAAEKQSDDELSAEVRNRRKSWTPAVSNELSKNEAADIGKKLFEFRQAGRMPTQEELDMLIAAARAA